jgi:hypothetical protein
MAADKEVFGRVTCPCCRVSDAMRITKDKNGSPFGFCDASCEVQLRIGGSQYRVNKFYEAHPLIKKKMLIEAVEGAIPAMVKAAEPVKTVKPEKQPEPAKKSDDDFTLFEG